VSIENHGEMMIMKIMMIMPGKGELLTRQPDVSDKTTSKVNWEQVRGIDKRNKDLCLEEFMFTLSSDFIHALKS
jgi:hypothetical protein